ncbi:MAG: nucleotidyltransferase domain-containing protein [Clostridia bacterium]|nr:nucleotidyltransferase domain-containing protein [Clostridia bacterium]
MISIEPYMTGMVDLLRQAFGKDLLYVGLQGSYLRGEATEKSDIDVMVILEEVSLPLLERYRTVLQAAGNEELSCGFLCSRADMAHWNPQEIPGLLRGTRDYYGSLVDFVPPYTEYDLKLFLQTGLGNLYHEITHRYIHSSPECSLSALADLHKPVFFLLQSLLLYRNNTFPENRTALAKMLTGEDSAVWEMLCRCRTDGHGTADDLAYLLTWCEHTLQNL